MVILFDFDGVIMDTETHYTRFWNKIGEVCLNRTDFGMTVKGQSLNLIYGKYFTDKYEYLQADLTAQINDMEIAMEYKYIPGALSLMKELKHNKVQTAVVTSSDDRKMDLVLKQHPELLELVNFIITSNQFNASKPDPECYLLAMSRLNVKPEECIVFEDSIFGIEAGKAAGAAVVGLATTNERHVIKPITDFVIDNFEEMTYDKLCTLV